MPIIYIVSAVLSYHALSFKEVCGRQCYVLPEGWMGHVIRHCTIAARAQVAAVCAARGKEEWREHIDDMKDRVMFAQMTTHRAQVSFGVMSRGEGRS